MDKGLGLDFTDVGVDGDAGFDFVGPILRVNFERGGRFLYKLAFNFIGTELKERQPVFLDLAHEFLKAAPAASHGDKEADVAGLKVADKFFLISGLGKTKDRGRVRIFSIQLSTGKVVFPGIDTEIVQNDSGDFPLILTNHKGVQRLVDIVGGFCLKLGHELFFKLGLGLAVKEGQLLNFRQLLAFPQDQQNTVLI